MASNNEPFDEVFVEESVLDSPLVRELRKTLPSASFHVIPDEHQGRHIGLPLPTPRSPSRTLWVDRFKGRFLRSCPATRFYHCCGYTILHFAENCSLDCTYCILQTYLNQPYLRVFGNLDEMFDEVEKVLVQHKDTLFRIGTGEFTDSLLLDPWIGFSEHVVPFFARQPNAVLELKTKTVSIDRLKDLDHAGHTIVSWSLNAPSISARDEGRSASLDQRINAALKCLDWEYFLGFHFDPLFFFPGWEDEYDFTVKKLFEHIPPDRIVYISLGAFRFMPELKAKILSKRPKWKLVSGEFVLSPDGKKRYFVDIRVSLYRFMLDRIRSFAPDVCVYLCMESSSVWKRVFGFSPDEKGGLPAILDDAVKKTMKVGINCSRSAASLFLKKPQPV